MLNVFEMYASLGLDSSNFENGLGNAERKTEGLSATTVAVGKVMADAFEAVISKVSQYGQQIVEVGAQQETALAKVNTIMDTSVMNTEAMSSAIKDLSSEMGVSVTELSDTVYNAISATGDTAHAVELAGSASKLATAGFTDTSSALSVLTTAMNAYGMEADEVQHISDSLITVQNLGVTTVAELSSSMGKAIASASAYGVDLENLESAYISITKAGISTAEGTTYISSMMKELGDNGTDVAKILQEKTGMAFNEFLAQGNSLGDALGILSESVDGDATALMNLWSSAEAGKASSAIVGQGLDAFNENLKQLQNTSGETATAYEVMADTWEHRSAVLKTNFENIMSDIFGALQPLLEEAMDLFENDIMPLIEMGVEKFEEFIPVIADQLKPAFDSVKSVISDYLIPAFTWLTENLDTLLPIVAGVAGAFMAYEVLSGIITAVSVAQGILNAVMMANPIGLVIIAIAGLVASLVALYKTNENFKTMIDETWAKIQNFFIKVSGLPAKFVEIGRNIVDGVKNGIVEKWEAFKSWFNGLFDGLVDGVKDFLGIHSPSRVFAQIGSYMAEGMQEGWDEAFPDVYDGVMKDLDFSGASPTIDAVGFGGSYGSVYNQTINVNQQISTADELAQAIRIESRYGLMTKGVALG